MTVPRSGRLKRGPYRSRRFVGDGVGGTALIIVAAMFAAACAILIVLTLTGVIVDAPGRSQIVATIAAVVGLMFFGGGTVVLLVRYIRSR